jgi:hypothetical protein
VTARCSATTLAGARCRNNEWMAGLCGTHYHLRLRRIGPKPALGAVRAELRTGAQLRPPAALARVPDRRLDVWTLTFHPDGWITINAATDNPARLQARLATFLGYIAELDVRCLAGGCGRPRHAA